MKDPADPGIAARRTDVAWEWCRFDDLGVRRLQAIHRARQRVFVVEQACAFLDADDYDEVAFHLCASTPGRTDPVAYARVVDPGAKYEEPSIGRVLTTSATRGQGLGRELVRQAIVRTQVAWPGQCIRISAQRRLEGFYSAFGFTPIGAAYLDDGIEHIDMLLGPD